MNASITFWEKWQEQVKDLLPGVHGHQKKTLALCTLGIILSQSAVLQRMAEEIVLHGKSLAKMPSIKRRGALLVPWQTLFKKGITISMGRDHDKRYNTQLRDMIIVGRSKPSQIVSHRLPLSQAPDAFKKFDQRIDGSIKVILDPQR
jgi:glutathione-independent formaldehyde dehydrogenase